MLLMRATTNSNAVYLKSEVTPSVGCRLFSRAIFSEAGAPVVVTVVTPHSDGDAERCSRQ